MEALRLLLSLLIASPAGFECMFKKDQKVRRPGIEPGPLAWKASILTTELSTLLVKREACDEIRTRDLSLTKRVLCQLSYAGTIKWRIGVSIPVPRRC